MLASGGRYIREGGPLGYIHFLQITKCSGKNEKLINFTVERESPIFRHLKIKYILGKRYSNCGEWCYKLKHHALDLPEFCIPYSSGKPSLKILPPAASSF